MNLSEHLKRLSLSSESFCQSKKPLRRFSPVGDAKSIIGNLSELTKKTDRNTEGIESAHRWMNERNQQIQKLQVEVEVTVVSEINIYTQEIGTIVQKLEHRVDEIDSLLHETKDHAEGTQMSLTQEIEKIGTHDTAIEQIRSAADALQKQLDVLAKDYFHMRDEGEEEEEINYSSRRRRFKSEPIVAGRPFLS
jgi:chromosome segregation ATPase